MSGISPWVQGALGPSWQLTYATAPATYGSPPVPVDLTGLTAAALGVTIRNNFLAPTDLNYERAGTGTFTIISASAGQVTYDPSAADVATPGDYSLIFTLVPLNGKTRKWPPQQWVILPS